MSEIGKYQLPDVYAELDRLRSEVEAMRKDAERYRFMRQNIDVNTYKDGSGFYWHNQRGEFNFELTNGKRPSFEELIDAAMGEKS